jgi:hypothetical protein
MQLMKKSKALRILIAGNYYDYAGRMGVAAIFKNQPDKEVVALEVERIFRRRRPFCTPSIIALPTNPSGKDLHVTTPMKRYSRSSAALCLSVAWGVLA